MNPVFTGGDLTTLRTQYRAFDYVFLCPNDVVFRAKVASVPTGDYLEISYNTVSVGAYTDIKEGMTYIISATSDHTQSLRIGRVAAAASSSVIPVAESPYPLSTSYYITVIDDYRVWPRVRKGQLVDGRRAFHNLPPAIENMRSFYIQWSDTAASFSFAPVGQPVADGATISGYAWSIPGATYTAGSSSSQNITVTIPADSHRWGRLTVTDSNGVQSYFVFQIVVQDPNAPSLPIFSVGALKLNRNAIHHASLTAYANVTKSDLVDGTRCVIVSNPTYAGGTLDLDPVRFVGQLMKETIVTSGPNDKIVSFEIAGLWEIAQGLSFNPLGIREADVPDAWDEMKLPTPQRALVYILACYSTFLNLCALVLDVTDSTWYGGEIDIPANSIGDAAKQILDPMNARLLGNPSGQHYLHRRGTVLTTDERNDLDEIITLTTADLRNINMDRSHEDAVGRIVIGFGGYQTSDHSVKVGKASAPSVTLGNSPVTQTFGNQLMQANQSDEDLLDEARRRAGDLLAELNPEFTLSSEIRDGLAWLTPSDHQWLVITWGASSNARGIALSSQRFLLTSVEVEYNTERNTHRVSIEATPETQGGDAFIVAAITPDAQSLDMVTNPLTGSYDGVDLDGSYNSAGGSVPIFNRGNGGGIGTTLPADQEAEQAASSPTLGSRTFAIAFDNPSAVNAGFLSQLGETYKFTVKGSAQVSGGGSFNFATDEQGFGPFYGGAYATYESGVGWGRGSFNLRIAVSKAISGTITEIRLNFNDPFNDANLGLFNAAGTIQYDVYGRSGSTWIISGLNLTDGVGVNIYKFYGGALFMAPETLRLVSMVVVATPKYGDACYTYEKDADGNAINVAYQPGLKIDNSAPTPPLFDESHEYQFEIAGTGSQFACVYYDTNYADNQHLLMTIKIEGAGAGS